MAPFYGWGSTASRLEPLRGGSLLFTTKFPEVPYYQSLLDSSFYLIFSLVKHCSQFNIVWHWGMVLTTYFIPKYPKNIEVPNYGKYI